MNKIEIGINQRIPVSLLEMAVLATLQGKASHEYFAELASMEYNGENRIHKATYVMNRLTMRNPILPYLLENKEAIFTALQNPNDRTLILAGIINAAYPFGYDLTSILGRYLHIQPQVTTALLTSKLAEKYGSNRSLPNAMNCIIPMLIEAGLFHRPTPGFFEVRKAKNYSSLAFNIYRRSFLLNNPLLPEDADPAAYPYFEFVEI